MIMHFKFWFWMPHSLPNDGVQRWASGVGYFQVLQTGIVFACLTFCASGFIMMIQWSRCICEQVCSQGTSGDLESYCSSFTKSNLGPRPSWYLTAALPRQHWRCSSRKVFIATSWGLAVPFLQLSPHTSLWDSTTSEPSLPVTHPLLS